MTSCWRSQSASVVSSSGFEIERPALLTTRSTPPNARTARRKASTTCVLVGDVDASPRPRRPGRRARRRPPRRWRRRCRRRRRRRPRPRAGGRWPCRCPEPAPVTSATRVASGFGFGSRASLASSSAQYSMRNFSASGDRRVGRDRLGAAHHVDRVDVELAGDPGRLLVRAEAEHPDAGHQHDRRVGAAHRRAVGRRVPLVVGAVVLAVRRVQLAEPLDGRLERRASAAGRGPAARPWSAGSGPGTTCRARRAADARRATGSRARRRVSLKWPTCGRSVEARPRRTGSSAAARSRRSRRRAAARARRRPRRTARAGRARR